jgi:hypothetical protein
MARAMQQIGQEIAAIEEKIVNFAQQLHEVYSQYLSLLNQSARKQLILASYQICTQTYPESFLKLSLSDRQKLQDRIRKLAQTMQSQLLNALENPRQSSPAPVLSDLEPQRLELSPTTEEQPQQSEPEPENEAIANPEELFYWCEQVEKKLHQILETRSQEANVYLQEFQILPIQVPAKALEIAMQAEGSGVALGGSPNTLNLMVESDRPSEEETSIKGENTKITKLTAIHLRLSEIEFSDPTLNLARNQIRSSMEKLAKIRQQYRQKQREYAIAEAEAAWRSIWFE